MACATVSTKPTICPMSRTPMPISPGRSTIGGASAPGAIGRSASVSPSGSVCTRKSIVMASSWTDAFRPMLWIAPIHLTLRAPRARRLPAEQRLHVHVPLRDPVVADALEAAA